jgi:hypothetical protein
VGIVEVVESDTLASRLEQQLPDIACEALVGGGALEVVGNRSARAVDHQRDELDPLFVLEAGQRRIVLLDGLRGVFRERLDAGRMGTAVCLPKVDIGERLGQGLEPRRVPFQDQDVSRPVLGGERRVLRSDRCEHVGTGPGCGEEHARSVESGRRGGHQSVRHRV